MRSIKFLAARKKWSAATVGVAVIGTFAAVALGSTGSGFHPTNLVPNATLANEVKLNSDRIKFQTKGPTDVRVQQIVIDPGGYSGWHHHPGVVIVTVLSGAVTFTESDCSSTTYGPGDAFVESGDVPGQGSSAGGATIYVTFIAPHADPPVFRIEDDPVTCP